MINILITGANGFIGTNLVNKLKEKPDVNIICLVRTENLKIKDNFENVKYKCVDYSNNDLIKKIIIEQDINIVYHLAWSSNPEIALKNTENDIISNVIPSINLINSCIGTNVKNFIFISSGGTIYGNSRTYPIKETNLQEPISAYGVGKLSIERYLKMYNHLYDFNYVIFRPSNPYGPFQNLYKNQGVISIFLYRALLKEKITIWGDGRIIRDYFYIDDMISALISALNFNSQKQKVFNLGGVKGYSLNDLIEIIEKSLNTNVKISYEQDRQYDADKIILDSSLAKKHLNWTPRISLEEGVSLTAKWLKNKFDL